MTGHRVAPAPEGVRAHGDTLGLADAAQTDPKPGYRNELDAVVAIVIVIVNLHAGGIGKVEQLPRQFQLDVLAGTAEIRQRVKRCVSGVGVAIAQQAGLKGFRPRLLFVTENPRAGLKNHMDRLKPGAVLFGRVRVEIFAGHILGIVGIQRVVAILHQQAGILPAAQHKQKIRCAPESETGAFAVGRAGLLGGVDGQNQRFLPEAQARLVDTEVKKPFVILHADAGAVLVGNDGIRIAPLRNIAVHIADTLFLAGVEGEQAEILFVGLVVTPVGVAAHIDGVHRVPCALEPLVLPGKDRPARAARGHDVLITGYQRLSLLALGHMSLIAAGVLVPLRHAAAGGNAELRDDHRHGMVRGEQPEIRPVAVGRAVRCQTVAEIHFFPRQRGPLGPVHIGKKVLIIGIGMVAGELAGQDPVGGTDMLHVHGGALAEKAGHLLRIREGVGGLPVGEGEQTLFVVTGALVGQQAVPHLGQHGLEGRSVPGGVEILALIAVSVRVFLVGVGNGHVLPLHAQNIADDPLRNIAEIQPGAHVGVTDKNGPLPVDDVHHHQCVIDEFLAELVVKGIHVGVLDVIIDPHALQKIERLFAALVILIKGVIEIIGENGIDTNGVGAHFLYLGEPAQVGLLVNGVVGGPMPRQAGAHVDAPNRKFLPPAVLLKLDGLALCAHEGGGQGVGGHIDIKAGLKNDGEQGQQNQQDCCHRKHKAFHGQSFTSLNFFTWEGAEYWRSVSMLSSIHAPRLWR